MIQRHLLRLAVICLLAVTFFLAAAPAAQAEDLFTSGQNSGWLQNQWLRQYCMYFYWWFTAHPGEGQWMANSAYVPWATDSGQTLLIPRQSSHGILPRLLGGDDGFIVLVEKKK